jgi:hypothetical protein
MSSSRQHHLNNIVITCCAFGFIGLAATVYARHRKKVKMSQKKYDGLIHQKLADEIILEIAEYLEPYEYIQMFGVCKRFHRVLGESSVLSRFMLKSTGIGEIAVRKGSVKEDSLKLIRLLFSQKIEVRIQKGSYEPIDNTRLLSNQRFLNYLRFSQYIENLRAETYMSIKWMTILGAYANMGLLKRIVFSAFYLRNFVSNAKEAWCEYSIYKRLAIKYEKKLPTSIYFSFQNLLPQMRSKPFHTCIKLSYPLFTKLRDSTNVFYYEIELIHFEENAPNTMFVGFVFLRGDTKIFGLISLEGLILEGRVLHTEVAPALIFASGNFIGAGLLLDEKKVFFILNGNQIISVVDISSPENENLAASLLPFTCSLSPNQEFKVNFGIEKFKLDTNTLDRILE